jgi:hypothetical protein
MANGSYNPLAWNYSSASTWGYMAGGAIIGCVSGGVAYGVGAAASGALGQATTMGGAIFNGAVAGAAGGAAGGLVGGTFSAWSYGASFGDGLTSGFISAGIGGLGGAILGGIGGAIQYRNEMAVFHRGNDVLGINEDDIIPATDEFLKNAQKAWYPDAPMDKLDAFSVEHLSKEATDIFKANPETDAITFAGSKNGLFSGRSAMYFNSNAFSSSKQLFFTMGHEFIHVSQFAYLGSVRANFSLNESKVFHDMLEYHAYTYQSSLTADGVKGTYMTMFSKDYIAQILKQPYFNKLSFYNFGWVNNVAYSYPF